jgi:hypothetical protein
MSTFLGILIILAMLATVAALVRGIVIFLKTSERDLMNPGQGPSTSGLRQNKMMRMRIAFQALAIVLVALLLLARSHGS